MTHDPMDSPHASRDARYVFSYLHRRGGTMRLQPMLRHLRMDPATLVAAVNELAERYWITVVWRKEVSPPPEDAPRPFTDVARLCTTRFGRRKYRTTWPAD
jgi:hypothetical protein